VSKVFHFTRDFDWKVDARHVVAYKAGRTRNVLEACAIAAKAAGAGRIVADRATALPKPVVKKRKP